MRRDKPISLVEHFAEVKDPRTRRRVRHNLIEIILITICAMVSGADDWVAVKRFGRAKESWLKKRMRLKLPHGIPSHDTFGVVFAMLDPEQFQNSFLSWIEAISEVSQGEVVAIDGKQVRRSHDGRGGKGAIHMVSAWASTNRLVLGQVKMEEKSNEITAIPALLKLLTLKGCIVTSDAMGCQTDIAKEIVVEQEADYVLATKGNQDTLYEGFKDLFAYAQETAFSDIAHDFHQTIEKGHGRLEKRQYFTITDPEFIDYLNPTGKWGGLRSLGLYLSTEVRYYISSLAGEAVQFAEAVRSHWEIENKVHWVLDVAFREDDCRIRKGHGPQSLAVVRHFALNLLDREQSAQCGKKNKRLMAAWDEDYLFNILTH